MTDLVDRMAHALLQGQSVVLDLQERYRLLSWGRMPPLSSKDKLERFTAWREEVDKLLDEYEQTMNQGERK